MTDGKYIFLDFDNVVCTNATYKAWRTLTGAGRDESPKSLAEYVSLFDKKIVALINQICDETGAKIVISSSWRLATTQPYDVIEVMRLAGFTAEIVGKTPFLGHIIPRGHEIAEYIKVHGLELSQILILDDDIMTSWVPSNWSVPKEGYKKHGGRWLQTKGETGLTLKQTLRAIKMLGPISSN